MRSRWALLFSIQVLTGLILLGCHGRDDALNPLTMQKSRTISGTGWIQFKNVEGGCWSIRDADGKSYEPLGLSEEFKKDGLAVQFTLKTLPDVSTLCMVGVPAEVVDIQALAGP
jgi:hypothetical protein